MEHGSLGISAFGSCYAKATVWFQEYPQEEHRDQPKIARAIRLA
jgi:hypothetical protein